MNISKQICIVYAKIEGINHLMREVAVQVEQLGNWLYQISGTEFGIGDIKISDVILIVKMNNNIIPHINNLHALMHAKTISVHLLVGYIMAFSSLTWQYTQTGWPFFWKRSV